MSTAWEEMRLLACSLLETGQVATELDGLARVCQANPALFAAYVKEKLECSSNLTKQQIPLDYLERSFQALPIYENRAPKIDKRIAPKVNKVYPTTLPKAEGFSVMTATERGELLMQKMIKDGEVESYREAFALLHKRHPDIVRKQRDEGETHLHTVAPLVSLPDSRGYTAFQSLCEAVHKQHPQLTTREVEDRVMQSPAGQDAYNRHRADHARRVRY